jgi:chorismate mutase
MKLFALRGAAGVEENTEDAILSSTEQLLSAMMERNALQPDDIVSCILTLTQDLNAQFPAVAARNIGFDHVPLLCAQEIAVEGSMPQIVRVMMHYHGPNGHKPQHIYLGRATALRSDIDSAQ